MKKHLIIVGEQATGKTLLCIFLNNIFPDYTMLVAPDYELYAFLNYVIKNKKFIIFDECTHNDILDICDSKIFNALSSNGIKFAFITNEPIEDDTFEDFLIIKLSR